MTPRMTWQALHTRLSVALLLLLFAAGGLNLYSTLGTTDLYVQEVTQGMNHGLARNIAQMKHEWLLTEDGAIRKDGIEELLHWMMVVNPGANFYLLDLDGNVLAYDSAAGEVLSDRVALAPIEEFLDRHLALGVSGSERSSQMILGDDPRGPGARQIFSAAPIPHDGPAVGFLYIVLSSHHARSAAEKLRDSYILRLSTRNLLVYLGVVLLSGLLIFGLLTRPLRRLTERMREFRRQGSGSSSGPGPVAEPRGDDEVRLLDATFDEMTNRIQRQMEELERMAGVHRELIANVSHDLRTPIALLRGYLDTLALKGDAVSEQERDEYLQISLRQSERLGKLVDELFELTKLEAKQIEPHLERFRIAELVQDNVQRFRLSAAEKGVELRAHFDPDMPPVFADIGLMERALENLIENALRHTLRGGTVTVELVEDPIRLIIRVVDTGCGIPAEDLPHIFDRYYRSRTGGAAQSSGAGLGLTITRRIAELHGSELEVESEVGVGSTFSFSLSVAPRTHELTLADIARAVAAGKGQRLQTVEAS